jgi:nicotinamide-nucleotide amidase
MVAASLTDLSGSSNWFERGFVTYSNESKHQNLGVSMDLIQTHGAVSVSVAKEMAIGALKVSGADVSLAITGVAGPTGGSLEKPVGFVCFAWAIKKDGVIHADSEGVSLLSPSDTIDDSTRSLVRKLARDYSLQGMLERLQKSF